MAPKLGLAHSECTVRDRPMLVRVLLAWHNSVRRAYLGACLFLDLEVEIGRIGCRKNDVSLNSHTAGCHAKRQRTRRNIKECVLARYGDETGPRRRSSGH